MHYQFLKTFQDEDKDISDYLFSLKSALLEGRDPDFNYLIPSHFLKTIKELYDRRQNYHDVIRLADRLLENESSLDDGVKGNVRYYLCLSLARKRNKSRFLEEVHKISGSEHNFLLGFYYRLQGLPSEAKERLSIAARDPKTETRAKRELVQVLLDLEEYDEAISLAKQNYDRYPTNPFHIQAYFNCLLNSKSPFDQDLFQELVERLKCVDSLKAQELYIDIKSQYLALMEDNLQSALASLDEGISKFSDSSYLRMTRFEVSFRCNDLSEMEMSLKYMEDLIDESSFFYKQLIRARCIVKAKNGEKQSALLLINGELKGYPEKYRNTLVRLIEGI